MSLYYYIRYVIIIYEPVSVRTRDAGEAAVSLRDFLLPRSSVKVFNIFSKIALCQQNTKIISYYYIYLSTLPNEKTATAAVFS